MNFIKQLNKRYFNRLTLIFAGKKGAPFAAIHHLGRISKKTYTTPVIAVRHKGGFLIALTYGSTVDWLQNILAVNECKIDWQGHTYHEKHIQLVVDPQLRHHFPIPLSWMLVFFRTTNFALLT